MIPDHYTVDNLRKAMQDPSRFTNEISRMKRKTVSELRHLPHRTIGKKVFIKKYGDGVDIMERDWDNLIMLDGCRYDTFKNHNHITGELEKVVSKGSHSDEVMIANYHGKELHDTVYISANPHTDKTLDTNVFHKVIKTYSTTRWTHRKFENYHPRYVSDVAINNYEEFDDKRIIVHFMQPHAPYIGPMAEQVRSKLYDTRGVRITNAPGASETEDANVVLRNLLEAARLGYISDDLLEKCYIENLQIVLKEVEKVLDHFDGKSVVTSDHGEMLGNPETPLLVPERYGHPRRIFLPETRVVPWLVINSETRRDITSEEPLESDTVTEETVSRQLEALGYVT